MPDCKYILVPVLDAAEVGPWLRDHAAAIGLSTDRIEYLITGKPYGLVRTCTRMSYAEVEGGFLVECDRNDSEQEKVIVDNYIAATPGTKIRIYDRGKTPLPINENEIAS